MGTLGARRFVGILVVCAARPAGETLPPDDKLGIMAGMIRHDDIERVRQAADLYEVVSDSVSLKRSGSGEFMGLCPFHDEKTPSFAVRPALGLWHCFGCGLGGDVFAYVERHEGVGFADAVEILADKFGITLHYENSREGQRRKGSMRSRLLQANEEAQNFFARNLLSKEALPARQLLGGRTFTASQSEHFGCGYAPKGWDNLVTYLADKGFTQKEMIDAGLARQGKNGGAYDYFRGRLTWPIRDTAGRTLGFGARKLYDDDTIAAKYINTPDTQLYHKERVLYGLDLARKHILHDHEIVVVEGYTDVMACHLAGIKTAVATCGTAFGEQHAKIARRLIGDTQIGAQDTSVRGDKKLANPHIIFTFDGDAAGQKAARRAFRFNNDFLTQTFVAVIPGNLDPCDLRIHGEEVPTRDVRQAPAPDPDGTVPAVTRLSGDEAVRHEIHDMSRPLYDYMIDYTIGQYDLTLTPQKSKAVVESAALLAQISAKSSLLAQMYTKKVCDRLGVAPRQILPVINRSMQSMHLRPFADGTMSEEQRRAQGIVGVLGLEERAREGEPGAPLDIIQKRYLDLLVMQDDYRRDYQRLHLNWAQDPVYASEQQLAAVVVQMPQALDPERWGRLTAGSFNVPMFRALFTAVGAIGRFPRAGERIADWDQALFTAGGPQLESVITALAVTPLPIYTEDGYLPASRRQQDGSRAGRARSGPATDGLQDGSRGSRGGYPGPGRPGQDPSSRNGAGARAGEAEALDRRRQEDFPAPTAEETAYAARCLNLLVDAGTRTQLADLRRRYAREQDPAKKSALLRQIARLQLEQKTRRQGLFDQSFGRGRTEPGSGQTGADSGHAAGGDGVPSISHGMPGSLTDVPPEPDVPEPDVPVPDMPQPEVPRSGVSLPDVPPGPEEPDEEDYPPDPYGPDGEDPNF